MALRPVLSRLNSVLIALVCMLALASQAEAKKIVVVEAALESLEHDAANATATRLGNLVSNGLKVELIRNADALELLGRTIAAAPQQERTRRLEEISRDIQRGDDLMYSDPEAAIPVLDAARRELQELMESFVSGDAVHAKLFEAQMLLARSHLDNGDSKAAGEVMEQVIRRFGERDDITTDNYPPALVELYDKTTKRLARKKSGELRVMSATDEELEILINHVPVTTSGKKTARTPYTIERLLPGEYRVQVRRAGGDASMLHAISVDARHTTKVTIDLDFDLTLKMDAQSFELLFSDRQSYDRNIADYASRVGAAIGADEVLVVGYLGSKKTPRLVSQRVDVRSRRAVAATEMQVSRDGASDEQILQATQVLCGLAISKPIEPSDPIRLPEEPRHSGASPWYKDWLGWTLVGVGVASVGVAGYFTADTFDKIDCATNPYCGDWAHRMDQAQSAKDGRAIYGVLYGVGGAAIVGGILVFILRDRGPADTADATPSLIPTIAPFSAPEGTGLSLQGRF